MALVCLLHDASEAYMSDVPRPFKEYLQVYNELEGQLLSEIYKRFLYADITADEYRIMKQIDDDLLISDLKALFSDFDDMTTPELFAKHDYRVRPFSDVENEFMHMYTQLSKAGLT